MKSVPIRIFFLVFICLCSDCIQEIKTRKKLRTWTLFSPGAIIYSSQWNKHQTNTLYLFKVLVPLFVNIDLTHCSDIFKTDFKHMI